MDKDYNENRVIDFKTIDNFKPGQILELLEKSYAGLIDFFPKFKERLYKQWMQEDNDSFNNPAIIGTHLFFTCLDDLPVGYFSWDDRQYPIGIVGQNCILPEYRGRGYGIKQIEKLIDIFEEKGFKEIRVITGDHDFFKQAKMIYSKSGFKELKRTNGDLFELIEFYRLIEKR